MAIDLPPGDYIDQRLAQLKMDQGATDYAEAQAEALRRRYNLDRPFLIRFFMWIRDIVLYGDFGESFHFRKPVFEVIAERAVLTIVVSLSSLIFAHLIAIPAGIISAVKKGTGIDNIMGLISFVGLSTPNFLLALILIMFLFFNFGITPGGLFSPEYRDVAWSFGKMLDLLSHLIVPMIVLGTAGAAATYRIMRSEVLDMLGRQHVMTARAKGLTERVVIVKHVVREALNPIVSRMGMMLPGIIGGAAIVSIVLNLPTLGPVMLQSLRRRDTYLIASYLMVTSSLLLIGNLIADILLATVDPRIKYE